MILEVEAWKILTIPKVEQFVEEHLNENPALVALNHKKNEFPIQIVSERIKYLQKARKKLPSFFAKRCLFPPKAYEQSSSEAAARLKKFEGKRILDLTCGLGADVWNWSQHFDEVITLEPDPELFPIVQHNFQKLDLYNVTVLPETAEAFVEGYNGEPFEMVYADPDRRGDGKARIHHPLEGAPNLNLIMPRLRQLADLLVVKLSPMVELAELPLLFPDLAGWTVISVDGECKEVLAFISLNSQKESLLNQLSISRLGQEWHLKLPSPDEFQASDLLPDRLTFLAEPDVTAYKAHRLDGFLTGGPWKEEWKQLTRHGFLGSSSAPTVSMPARMMQIEAVFSYKPGLIRKHLKAESIRSLEITRRDFPFSPADIRAALKVKQGGSNWLWCTEINGNKWAFLGKKYSLS